MKTYEHRLTATPGLFRVVDRDGDWRFYFKCAGPEPHAAGCYGSFHEATGKYLRAITSTLDAGFAKGHGFYLALKRASADEWERRLQLAGDKGDAVHQAIAKIFDGEVFNRKSLVLAENNCTERPLSHDEWSCVLAFERFWTMHDCILVSHEQSVANLELGYAGTLDVIFRMRKWCGRAEKLCPCKPFINKLGLGDWKSGGGIYESHGAQVAALSRADLHRLIGDHRIDFTGVVRVGTKHKVGFEFEAYGPAATSKNFGHFKAALRLAAVHVPMFDPKCITDVADELSLTIEREDLSPTATTA